MSSIKRTPVLQMGSQNGSPNNGTLKATSTKKRSHTRPCDACAVRRVRCDLSTSPTQRCTNCINHDMECTNVRVRHKSGPKRIQKKTRENIVNLVNNNSTNGNNIISNGYGNYSKNNGAPVQGQQYSLINYSNSQFSNYQINTPSQLPISSNPNTSLVTSEIPLDKILPFLQIYQTWYYGLWPVLSTAHLVSKIIDNNGQSISDGRIILNDRNASYYALSCSVAATIAVQVKFLKSSNGVISVDNALPPELYANEAKRVRFLFDDKMDPSMDSLLSSFFLHMYYGNVQNGSKRGIVYLREAISMAQMLGLHDPETYRGKSSAEIHRCKKIYYLLLVTERYTCFHENLPVLLDPTVEMPSLQDEEYPELLFGFIELVEVFSATEKRFFQEISRKLFIRDSEKGNDSLGADLSMFQDYLQNQSTDMKRQWIGQMQSKLGMARHGNKISNDSQKLNIQLSKSWFQSLGWLVSSENFIVRKNESMENCFSIKFPMKIAQDFLDSTKDLPEFAFESNGAPGVCNKLLEIADSLYTFAMLSSQAPETTRAFDQMNTIFQMIVRFKGPDVQVPMKLYHKIESMIESRRLTFRQPDSIDELLLEDQQQTEDGGVMDQGSAFDLNQINVDQTPAGYNDDSLKCDMTPYNQFSMKNELSPYSQFTAYYSLPSPNLQYESSQISELQ